MEHSCTLPASRQQHRTSKYRWVVWDDRGFWQVILGLPDYHPIHEFPEEDEDAAGRLADIAALCLLRNVPKRLNFPATDYAAFCSSDGVLTRLDECMAHYFPSGLPDLPLFGVRCTLDPIAMRSWVAARIDSLGEFA